MAPCLSNKLQRPRSPAGIKLIPYLIRVFKPRDAGGCGLVYFRGQDQDWAGLSGVGMLRQNEFPVIPDGLETGTRQLCHYR